MKEVAKIQTAASCALALKFKNAMYLVLMLIFCVCVCVCWLNWERETVEYGDWSWKNVLLNTLRKQKDMANLFEEV